jgi:hypothetical protein
MEEKRLDVRIRSAVCGDFERILPLFKQLWPGKPILYPG